MCDIEEIFDDSYVYLRVYKDFISKQDDKPKSSAFSNTPKDGDNLSCDWDKYCTPTSSRELIGRQIKKDGSFKDFNLFFIWKMSVGKIRKEIFPTQDVKHDPICNDPEIYGLPNNRAHSIIIGEKEINNAEFRVSILKIGSWAIGP